MPRYFFHVHDGVTIPDDVGVELQGLRDAQILAVRRAGSLLQDDEIFWQGHEWSMDVVDETGAVMFTLSFSARDLGGLLRVKDLKAPGT